MSEEKYSVHIGPGRKLGAQLVIAPRESQGGIAVVVHTLPPKSLAAPPHRHSREDEYSFVIEGELTVWEEGRVQTFKAGTCVLKARNILHTFWNEGDKPLRFVEIIAPGDFAHFFAEVDQVQPDGPFSDEDMKQITLLSQKYGLEMEFDQIEQLMQEHGLEP